MYRSLLCLALLTLVSCFDASSNRRASTVVYASGADLQSINPLGTVHLLAKAVQKHVLFLTLAEYDTALVPKPRLADWSWNETRSSIVFRLRSDVMWHDGVPTTARDVVWTLEMARQPQVAYPRARDLSGITHIEEVDSLTVRISFERPLPTFPDVLTDLPILPEHRFLGVAPEDVRYVDFNRNPIGNGPFEFVEYLPNQRWVFERRDSFPADLGRPEIERFVVVVVDESATKLAALTSGELDFAGINTAHASFVDSNADLVTSDYPLRLVYALIWNLRRPPFDDIRVRRALSMALDRQLLVDAYLYGYGTLANGPVPPEHPWYVQVPADEYDPDRAASLLDEAGWRLADDGVRYRGMARFEFDLLTVGSGDVALEQMIQAQLSEVGVVVTIRQHEMSSFLALAQSEDRDFDALVTGIPGDLSLGYVAAMFEGQDAGPLAYPGYRSVEFDAMLEDVRTSTTEEDLESAWQRALQVLAADYPTTWLYHARGLQGANNRISNAGIDFRGELAGIAEWRIRGR